MIFTKYNRFASRFYSILGGVAWQEKLNKGIIKKITNSMPIGPKGDKHMSDSFIELLLPFKDNSDLLDQYISIHGGLRFGKLMEDLDAMAASIAYRHCSDDEITLLTAAVDRIDLSKSFDSCIFNVRMRGFVTFVGRSSMEVTIATDCEGLHEQWESAALAKFVFVARSPDGSKAITVPRLVIESETEKEIFSLGENRHKYRLRKSEQSLFRSPPTEEESQLIHRLLIKDKKNQELLVPISKTEMKSIRICHPQDRNIHNLIFGGHLMREAYELAYSTAICFTKGIPVLITTIDDLNFVHPVQIGSLLYFSGRIVYTDRDPSDPENVQRINVEVIADVIEPKSGSRLTTNTFHYTYSCKISQSAALIVIPETYTEAMKYLEGKRRVQFSF